MAKAPGTGYVKLHRTLLEWEWWADHSITRVFTYLMLAVNWQEKKWLGVTIAEGSMVTTYEGIAKACGLTEKQVRRSLEVLEKGSVIAREKAGKGQLVTLVNWEKHQGDEPEEGRQRAANRAAKGQAKGSERAATKEGEEREEGEEVRNSPNGEGQARSHGEMDINRCVDHLTEKIGHVPDGSQKSNRYAARNLLKKLATEYPKFDPVKSVLALIDAATSDPFHAKNATNFSYLLRHCLAIANAAKERKSKTKNLTNDEYGQAVAADLAKRAGDRANHAA